MVSIQYTRVQHGYCSRCTNEAKLYTLELIGLLSPKLVENEPDVHSGFCHDCWTSVARGLRRSLFEISQNVFTKPLRPRSQSSKLDE